jgi:hypothetical protein
MNQKILLFIVQRLIVPVAVLLMLDIQSNLDLRTQLVKNGCTYCEKYLNRGLDSHRLPCEVVQLANDLPKKLQKFNEPLELHVMGFKWSVTFFKKFQNFPKT